MNRFVRLAASLGLGFALVACAAPDPLEEDLPDMGSFRLSHNIVVTDNMQLIPPSRGATGEEWEAVLEGEIERRFGGYEGDRLYHIGIAVEGYALAPPGIPLVFQPRSVLALSVNVWDDALGRKLHEEPEQVLVLEGLSPETMILGSGLTRNREEQMQVLARNAARRIHLWMLRNPEWFNIDPDVAAEAAAAVGEIAGPEVDLDALAAEAEANAAAGTPDGVVGTVTAVDPNATTADAPAGIVGTVTVTDPNAAAP
ncbi:MAG: hypothetical protein AAF376_15585 [Pseudomonadota bacterium]